jgi:hypothetical protein
MTINNLKDSSFSLDCCVGSLIEDAPHVAIALWGSVAVVDPRALLLARTCTNPRRKLLGRRKCCCSGTHFGNDLLCRIDAQTRYFSQPFNRVLMWTEQICHLLIELTDLLVDQSQLLKHHV